ncbi:Nitrogen permease regulator 2 [Microsporum audouinii]
MHKPSLTHLVYNALFSKPRGNDPSSFSSHITRNLVPEVRVETSTFYGTLDCIEAQYPGLDYSYAPHRMRLGRFHHHKKLFKVFDELKLTEAEISSLCRWEGTKSARERYERDTGIKVRDTTADEIKPAAPSMPPSVQVHSVMQEESNEASCSSCPLIPDGPVLPSNAGSETNGPATGESGTEDSSSDEDLESYGVALNEHLLEATAARERGINVALDEIWEQWLKEAIERGGYTDMLDAIREGRAIDFTHRGVSLHQHPQHHHHSHAPVSGPSSSVHPSSRPKVVHQVPDGAIVPSPSAPPGTSPLFSFSDVSFFVIPRQELCGNLIHVCTGGHRILGSPVCMKSPRYDRNEFIFNFCIVLNEEDEWGTYKTVVQKLAHLLCGLEEQSGFLSKDTSKDGEGKIYSLCETLMEDLNNYYECMIPIDELNTLNVKLFPLYPSPPIVKAWHVPLFTVRCETFMDENWDLTMRRIVPYINGINSVRKISILSDADFTLTCRAIRHLIYYGCAFLLDIFSFSAIYAPTAEFSSTIVPDKQMQCECARYVNICFSPSGIPSSSAKSMFTVAASSSTSHQKGSVPRSSHGISVSSDDPWVEHDSIWPKIDTSIPSTSGEGSSKFNSKTIVDGVGLVELYSSLKQGQTVKQWYLKHMRELANIDVRRFITFGVIKGFLYRVHKYPFATGRVLQHHHQRRQSNHQPPSNSPMAGYSLGAATEKDVGSTSSHPFSRGRLGSTASGIDPLSTSKPLSKTASTHSPRDRTRNRRSLHRYEDDGPDGDEDGFGDDDSDGDGYGEGGDYGIDNKTLAKYLDGTHCFDEICVELEVTDKELTARLKRYPREVVIIHS